MENILLITSIVTIAFGVLQIILFFKIWGMTNDVNKIKWTLSSSTPNKGFPQSKFEMLLGNEDKAKELLKREFLKDVIDLYQGVDTDYYDHERLYAEKYTFMEMKYKKEYPGCHEFMEFGKYATYPMAKEKLIYK